MPDVLPTINNEPAQGIQALLDTTYLWNPDVANDLIERINALLEKLDGVKGSIPPYSELEAPVSQYQPCYNGDNVYVAAADIETLPATFDPAQWILIATKAPVLQAGAGIDINGNEISVEQQVLSDAAAGATAVQPEDLATVATSGSYNDLSNKPALGTAAYASTSDFATAAQGGKADTAVQPGDLGTAAYAATTDFATAAQGTLADTAVQPSDLAAVATSGSYTDLSNKPAIDGVTLTSQTTKADIGLAGVYKYKGSVATYADLANIQSPEVGDVYNVEDTGDNYAWTGTEWDQLGGTFVPPVTSVNSKTGAVVLSAEDVGATPQYSTMPTASESKLGNIIQYIGATTENYTNGYFYKCVASDSGVGSGEIDVNYWYPDQFTPPVTGSVDVDVFSAYLEQNNLAPISDGRIEITFVPNANNIIFAYNVDTNWTRVDIPWATVTTQAAEDIFANMGFDFDFSGIPTYRDSGTGGQMPSATVYFWEKQPVMGSIGVYKDFSELPEPTEENVGTPYLVTPYDSGTLTPYSPEYFMSVPYIINYIDGEAEVTGYGLTPETQPTDVMIDWATLESYLNSQETGFDWTNDTITISLNGENYLDVMYNADFSASAGVQTDGTVANIQQELENMGISVDLTGYTQFQFLFLRLPTEKGYENRRVPAFVPTSGMEETGYVLKADGNGGAYWAEESGGSGLPDQTGNAGKFLTTDGTDASWGDALQNTSTGNSSLTIEGIPTSEATGTNAGKLSRAEGAGATAYGWFAEARAAGATAVGSGATVRNLGGIALGRGAETNDGGFVIALWDSQKHQYNLCDMGGNVPSDRLKNAINKYSTMPTAASTNEGWLVQFTGTTDSTYTHGYIYECTRTTTPASTSETVSSSTMSNVTVNVATFVSGLNSISEGDPEAYSDLVDEILDGTSPLICSYIDDGSGDVAWCLLLEPYTMVYGRLEGVGITYSGAPAEGDTITVDYTPESTTYAWRQTDVQPQGDSLPSQTGQSGKFLTTDGTDASWGSISALQNTATGTDALTILGTVTTVERGINVGKNSQAGTYGTSIGYNATATGTASSAMGMFANASGLRSTALGSQAETGYEYAVAIGWDCQARAAGAIQIGGKYNVAHTNSDANTLKVGNANGNFEMMSADGTIPEARLADTTNAAHGQVLTLDNNNNAVWQTPSTAVTSTTATLVVANWSSNTQTLTVNGVTSSNVVIVSPQPLSSGDYATAGVLCTAQNTNSLTFTCTQTPSNAIDLSIVIIG